MTTMTLRDDLTPIGGNDHLVLAVRTEDGVVLIPVNIDDGGRFDDENLLLELPDGEHVLTAVSIKTAEAARSVLRSISRKYLNSVATFGAPASAGHAVAILQKILKVSSLIVSNGTAEFEVEPGADSVAFVNNLVLNIQKTGDIYNAVEATFPSPQRSEAA